MKGISKITGILIMCAAFLFAGCTGGGQEGADSQTAGEETAAKTIETPTETTEQPAKTAEKPVEKKPTAPPVKMVTIPAGSALTVVLGTLLRTDSNKVGDQFTASTLEAVVIAGQTVIPAGTKLSGKLTAVEKPHRTRGKAKMTLLFESFTDVKGKVHALAVQPVELEAEGDKISDEEKVAAGGVLGGAIGAITGKNKAKGAAIGAAIGAAAGGAVALATKGGQLELTPGQQIGVVLTAPAEIPVPTGH